MMKPILIKASTPKDERKIFARKLMNCITDLMMLCDDHYDESQNDEIVLSWMRNTISWNPDTWEFFEWSSTRFMDMWDEISYKIVPRMFIMAASEDTHDRLYDILLSMTENGLHIDNVFDKCGDHISYYVLRYGSPSLVDWYFYERFDIDQYTSHDMLFPRVCDTTPLSELCNIDTLEFLAEWIYDNKDDTDIMKCNEVVSMLHDLRDSHYVMRINELEFDILRFNMNIRSFNNDLVMWSSCEHNGVHDMIEEINDSIRITKKELTSAIDDKEMMISMVDMISELLGMVSLWPSICHKDQLFPECSIEGPISPQIFAYISRNLDIDNCIVEIKIKKEDEYPIKLVVRTDYDREVVHRMMNKDRVMKDGMLSPSDVICVFVMMQN